MLSFKPFLPLSNELRFLRLASSCNVSVSALWLLHLYDILKIILQYAKPMFTKFLIYTAHVIEHSHI